MCRGTMPISVDQESHVVDPSSSKIKGVKALDDLGSNGTEITNTSDASTGENSDLEQGLMLPKTKKIPVRFLYDDLGSELYEQITELEEYYPYMEEKTLLMENSDDIVANLPSKAVFIELGCGDGSKTALLLQALARRDGPENVQFVGIDVSEGACRAAQRNLQLLCPEIPSQNLQFVAAEYFQGLAEARKRHPDATLCMLWLGSSVGNFTLPEAAAFLADLRVAAGEQSALLLCTDLWKDPKVLHTAYDDPKGVTRKFILNGMVHALRALGHPDSAAAMELFEYECIVNSEQRQVEMWVEAKYEIKNVLPGVDIAANERILMEISRKFTPEDILGLAMDAGLCLQATWASAKYSMQLLLPPTEALRQCWADTDALFSHNLISHNFEERPIDLRHPFGFYYGHVAAFSRLKMLPERSSTPYDVMFSRGIDPIVLDPSQCHSHPEIPQEGWPSEEEIRKYVAEAREDVLNAAAVKAPQAGHAAMHALMMSLEHERLHQETLCYMLAQQRKRHFESEGFDDASSPSTSLAQQRKRHFESEGFDDASSPSTSSSLSPSGLDLVLEAEIQNDALVAPFFFNRCSYLATASSRQLSTSSETVLVPGNAVFLGIHPSEKHGFVWDNELGTAGPRTVPPLHVGTRPISVAQFRDFIVTHKGYSNPELWDEADFAHFSGTGHVMPSTWSKDSDGELHIHMPEGTFHWKKVADCPAYVSLAEAMAYCKLHGGRIMTEPEYMNIIACAGDAVHALQSNGWEWTQSPLEPFEGFAADPLYPEYSTDFFDGLHFVLKGSCPYTHPSVRRLSFRNYYQKQYPHMFAKFRIVKDVE